jgi:hypothetical protein
MNKDNRFDLDLKFGQDYEQKLEDLLKNKGKIEVKTERDIWKTTGNIAIEIRCRGKASGISVTKADWWFHILSYKDEIKGMICVPVDELKSMCKAMLVGKIARIVKGGDDNEAQMILVPISKILQYL